MLQPKQRIQLLQPVAVAVVVAVVVVIAAVLVIVVVPVVVLSVRPFCSQPFRNTANFLLVGVLWSTTHPPCSVGLIVDGESERLDAVAFPFGLVHCLPQSPLP